MMRRTLATSALATAALLGAAVPAVADSFRGLGGTANAVSADGSTVVGVGPGGSFRWTAATGWIDPGTGGGGTAIGVSGDGSTVLGRGAAGGYLWTAATGWTSPIGSTDSPLFFTGISADGSVLVGNHQYQDSRGITFDEGFRWSSADGLEYLHSLFIPESRINGVSGDGLTLFGQAQMNPIGQVAAVWSKSQGGPGGSWSMVTSFPVIDPYGEAMATSTDGSVVVGRANVAPGVSDPLDLHAFLYNRTTYANLDLGVLSAGDSSVATAVSGDGAIVLGTSGARPFLWTAGMGMVDLATYLRADGLDLTGWTLTRPTGISADGSTIVGAGLHNGVSEGWIARISNLSPAGGAVPEPATIAMFALGLAGAWARRGRRRRGDRPSV